MIKTNVLYRCFTLLLTIYPLLQSKLFTVQHIIRRKRNLFQVLGNHMDAFFLHGLKVKIIMIYKRTDADSECIVIDVCNFLLMGSCIKMLWNNVFEIFEKFKAVAELCMNHGFFNGEDKGIIDHMQIVADFLIPHDGYKTTIFVFV